MTDIEMGQTTCWCGTPFTLPRRLLDSAVNAGHTIYCPHGHTVVWRVTEADKLRRERDRLKQQIACKDDEIRAEAERALRAEKETARLRRRAKAGVCPCCNRSFVALSRHMKSKHPNFEVKPMLKAVA